MKEAMRGRSIHTIFVLMVFGVFAFSVLMVLMLGASIYRNINDITLEGQYEHTALSYVWTKTKNFDDADSIEVGEFNGVPAIIITEHIAGSELLTVIYHYDGWLYELFFEANLEFLLGDGVRLMRIDDFIIEDAGSGVIRVMVGGKRLLISPRGILNVPLNGGDE